MTKANVSRVNEGALVLTAKRVNLLLDNLTGGDARVEQRYFSNGTHKDFREWYVCIDSFRPGKEYKGKSPKLAARNAGFHIQ